jgi:predicted thioredoxin/glutaredoxin
MSLTNSGQSGNPPVLGPAAAVTTTPTASSAGVDEAQEFMLEQYKYILNQIQTLNGNTKNC